MKFGMLAITTISAATFQVARAQEVTPEVPPETTPSEAAEPPVAAAPPAAESAPAPAPTVPSPPPAAEPEFGAKGELVVSIDLPFMSEGPQFAIAHETTSMGGPSSTVIEVEPSVDYFVAPGISLGAQIGIEHGSSSSVSADVDSPNGFAEVTTGVTSFSVEARVGYAIPLADTVSVWPRLGLGLTYTRTSSTLDGVITGYAVPLSLTLPFLWQPGGHFFVGGGPAFLTQLVNRSEGASGPKTTDYGIVALIGGTIGGR